MKYLLAFLIMGSIAIFVGSALGRLNSTDTSDGDAIKAAHSVIISRLRDPSSAQFRGEIVLGSAGARTVCGDLNAKNGYGGYTGFAPFIYDETTRLVTMASTEAEARDVIRDCLQAQIKWLKQNPERAARDIEAARR